MGCRVSPSHLPSAFSPQRAHCLLSQADLCPQWRVKSPVTPPLTQPGPSRFSYCQRTESVNRELQQQCPLQASLSLSGHSVPCHPWLSWPLQPPHCPSRGRGRHRPGTSASGPVPQGCCAASSIRTLTWQPRPFRKISQGWSHPCWKPTAGSSHTEEAATS